jgi:hypothetical protein
MIIAKASRTGNYKRLNSNSVSVEITGMSAVLELGKIKYMSLVQRFKNRVPRALLFNTISWVKFFTESLVQFQMGGGLMFHKIILKN